MELYRFRSCDKLLGDDFKELEDQYFYFAPPSDQNDPMEGKIEFYWQGDKIAWFGLLKDYVWQLFLIFTMLHICDSVEDLEKIPLQKSEYPLENAPILKSRTVLEKKTVNAPTFQMFVDAMTKTDKKFMAKDVQLLLSLLHPIALDIAFQELSSLKIFDINPQKIGVISTAHNQDIEKQILTYLESNDELSMVAAAWNCFMQQADLSINWNIFNEKEKIAFQKRKFFQYEYPTIYIRKSQKELCSSNWLFTCFNTAIQNPATWSYYADQHRGIGLIFDTETDFLFDFSKDKNIKLNPVPINYNNKIISRNFFESIGEIAGSEISHWFYIDNQVSSIWDAIRKNENEWRKKYWDDQEYSLYRKGSCWQHEQEYRILLSDMFNKLPDINDRKFYYKFNILKGIAFGIRTPFEDKKKIVDILNRKCKENNRKDFPVYQAQYDKTGNYIEKFLLMTLPLDDKK